MTLPLKHFRALLQLHDVAASLAASLTTVACVAWHYCVEQEELANTKTNENVASYKTKDFLLSLAVCALVKQVTQV